MNGNGRVPHYVTCRRCEGTGDVAIVICGKCEREWTANGDDVCPACGNDGEIEGHAIRIDRCTDCAGAGELLSLEDAWPARPH